MQNQKFVYTLPLALVICFSNFFCAQKQKPSENPTTKNQRDSVLEDAAKKRAAWSGQLQVMTLKQLADQLSKESMAGLEPFNSMAYSQMVSRGEQAADSLINLITVNDRSSLLALLALRRLDKTKFQSFPEMKKGQIFSDALKSARKFNTFGLPHIKWEEAAMAIIESGDTAKLALYPLLTDQRPAPVWGSEDYAQYLLYNYRVCDYAFAILKSNREGAVRIDLPRDSTERNKQIQQLLKSKK